MCNSCGVICLFGLLINDKIIACAIMHRPVSFHIQGGPAKVRPTYIFDGNI